MGLRVIGEKVESEDQLHRVRSLGVDLFQGYAVQAPQIHAPPALPGCDAVILGKTYLMTQAEVSDQALALLICSDPALMARLLRLQAVYAPSQVARSETLVDLVASIPRPVLLAWLAMMNVAAVHGRGRQRSLLVRRALIAYRAHLLQLPLNPASEEFSRELFDHYVMLINIHMQARMPRAAAA
jgi:c-di-GMP-related signal transduction protein